VLVLVFTPIKQHEEVIEWHPSEVTRTRIRVIGVDFSEVLIKGKEIQVELARNSSNPKTTEKWGEI